MPIGPGHPLLATHAPWLRAAGLIAFTLVALTACRLPYIPPFTPPPPSAVADLADASGRIVGKAVLVEQSDGARLLLDLAGVPPGIKAVHVHEVGRCDAPSFESAGAHFNPTKAQHGTANPRGPHKGDLPNVTVDSTGHGHLETTISGATLGKKGGSSLLDPNGSALVLHAGPDDLRTDPDGNSGARIACGVIRRAG
jgi:superoxide dismutase, Cu-Zn family